MLKDVTFFNTPRKAHADTSQHRGTRHHGQANLHIFWRKTGSRLVSAPSASLTKLMPSICSWVLLNLLLPFSRFPQILPFANGIWFQVCELFFLGKPLHIRHESFQPSLHSLIPIVHFPRVGLFVSLFVSMGSRARWYHLREAPTLFSE